MTPSARVLAAKILVVDDQEASLDLMEQILHSAGYKSVLSTSDPAEVYALHRLHQFDLILLDLKMFPMDGFMVMDGLKTHSTQVPATSSPSPCR
ncbi:MAG: response regulator [Archangium sp.]|nr:response regulator [Archangium sp.]MDP3570573.1 response regulator [Archangium sp.]